MDNDKVKVLDGGYGLIGNLNIHRILLDLPHENRMQYEKQLEKENPIAYKEYKEWEKYVEDASE